MPTKFDEQIIKQTSITTQAALDIYFRQGYKVYQVSYDNGIVTVRLSSLKHPNTFVVTLTEYRS